MSSPGREVPLYSVSEAGQRITACNSCQKQKIKCVRDRGGSTCQRCRRRGITCALRQSAPPRTSTDNNQSSPLLHDLRTIHTALNELRRDASKPPLPPLRSTATPVQTTVPVHTDSSALSLPGQSRPDDVDRSDEVSEGDMVAADGAPLHLSTNVGASPMNSLFEITRLRSLPPRFLATPAIAISENNLSTRKDIISKGLLDRSEADRLVHIYLRQSDHYLYNLARSYHDLESIRKASPVLLVALCAVAALQEPSSAGTYITCKSELQSLAAGSVFNPKLDLEDLRGLCIASFWLYDVSWALSGLAIRHACEVDLQGAFKTAIAGGPSAAQGPSSQAREDAAEKVRIWYMLYICDQHLSILHTRTPMLHITKPIRLCESFEAASPIPEWDHRFASQVSLLRLLSTASELLDCGSNERLPIACQYHLRKLNGELDLWLTKWGARAEHHPVVGDYPSKAVHLHYHFAQLYVCSQVFRGIGADDPLPAEFHDTAQTALESAKSIIRLTTQDADLIEAFPAIPHYFHTMISYACAFLLKASIKYRNHVDTDARHIREEIAKVIRLCENSVSCRYNLSQWIGRGLRTLLSTSIGYPEPEQAQGDLRQDETAPVQQPNVPYDPYVGYDFDAGSDPDMIWNAALQATSRIPAIYTPGALDQASFQNDQSAFQQLAGMQAPPGDFSSDGVNFDGLFGLGLDLL